MIRIILIISVLIMVNFVSYAGVLSDKCDESGKCHCGENCLFEIQTDAQGNKNLRIYNENKGETANIEDYAFRTVDYEDVAFNNVLIDGDFDSIGAGAFNSEGTRNERKAISGEVFFNGKVTNIRDGAFAFNSLTNLKLPDELTNIEFGAFSYNNIQVITLPEQLSYIGGSAFQVNNLSEVIIPDSVAGIGEFAFYYNPLENIVIPDTALNFGIGIFGNDINTLADMNIVCNGSKKSCQYIKNYMENYISHSRSFLGDFSKSVKIADFDTCTSENYYWNGANCVREPDKTKRQCCASCKDMGGWCNRVRYTPAEAAEILRDDNNTVTITFKK